MNLNWNTWWTSPELYPSFNYYLTTAEAEDTDSTLSLQPNHDEDPKSNFGNELVFPDISLARDYSNLSNTEANDILDGLNYPFSNVDPKYSLEVSQEANEDAKHSRFSYQLLNSCSDPNFIHSPEWISDGNLNDIADPNCIPDSRLRPTKANIQKGGTNAASPSTSNELGNTFVEDVLALTASVSTANESPITESNRTFPGVLEEVVVGNQASGADNFLERSRELRITTNNLATPESRRILARSGHGRLQKYRRNSLTGEGDTLIEEPLSDEDDNTPTSNQFGNGHIEEPSENRSENGNGSESNSPILRTPSVVNDIGVPGGTRNLMRKVSFHPSLASEESRRGNNPAVDQGQCRQEPNGIFGMLGYRRNSRMDSDRSRRTSFVPAVGRRRARLERRPSAVRLVAKTSKSKHRPFMTLNFCLILLGTLGVVLTIKDATNAKLGFRDLNKAKREFFDVGFYPMSGMGMLMAGGCLDALTMFVFLCGYFCECQYYRHYMRFVFINLLLAITATVVLFLTEDNAEQYLQRYFKMTMTIEYGATSHPEPLGNFIDSVQTTSKCCGYKAASDWKTSEWFANREGDAIPNSCCNPPPIPKNTDANSHSINSCTFSSIHLNTVGCREFIFATKGTFRMFAKFVGLIKILFLVAVIVLCSLLYKDTWRVKEARKIGDTISPSQPPIDRAIAIEKLHLLRNPDKYSKGNLKSSEMSSDDNSEEGSTTPESNDGGRYRADGQYLQSPRTDYRGSGHSNSNSYSARGGAIGEHQPGQNLSPNIYSGQNSLSPRLYTPQHPSQMSQNVQLQGQRQGQGQFQQGNVDYGQQQKQQRGQRMNYYDGYETARAPTDAI